MAGLHGCVRVHVFRIFVICGSLRVSEQIPDKHLHARSTLAYVAEEFEGLAVELIAITAMQQLAEDFNAAERFLEIMAR